MDGKKTTRQKAKAVAPVLVGGKTKPGPRTQQAIDRAAAEFQERPVRTYVDWEEVPGGFTAVSPHNDQLGHGKQLLNAFGTTSSSFMMRNFAALEAAVRARNEERGDEPISVSAALALMEAIGPQDELEGALAVQMASNHALTMEMLCRAKSTSNTEHLEMYGNMAVKLQRTFTAQIEALARMRGKGQQTVRVEHVTVHPGGQAIVGDVHHHPQGRAGAQAQIKEPPYESGETAPGALECKTLPSAHASGNGMPITGDAERPVPHPRRTVTRRGPRQSKRAQARVLEPGDDRDQARAAADEGGAA